MTETIKHKCVDCGAEYQDFGSTDAVCPKCVQLNKTYLHSEIMAVAVPLMQGLLASGHYTTDLGGTEFKRIHSGPWEGYSCAARDAAVMARQLLDLVALANV